jgi:hypothetical protein
MVEAREFVRVWQSSTSVAEVAAKTRTKKSACRVRANRYRAEGVPLKEFPPVEYVSSQEFYDDLRQYAESLLPKDDQPGGD